MLEVLENCFHIPAVLENSGKAARMRGLLEQFEIRGEFSLIGYAGDFPALVPA